MKTLLARMILLTDTLSLMIDTENVDDLKNWLYLIKTQQLDINADIETMLASEEILQDAIKTLHDPNSKE